PRRAPGLSWWESVRFLGSLRDLKLVPAKRRCLVPGDHRDGAQSYPPALITLGRALRRGATRRVTPAVGLHVS
ncbi:MAG TPA: hypothetical protein VJ821_02375, partial [Anaerolineales bacterium]|nr:hypothetical protein [Anaerolineales bacterium]